MGLFKRHGHKTGNEQSSTTSRPQNPGDPLLPGTCGYVSPERVTKNGMPNTRLTYVRPDGNAQTPHRKPGLGAFRPR